MGKWHGTGLSTLYNFRSDNPSALIIQDSTTYSTLIHGIFPGSEIKSDALLSKSNVIIAAGITTLNNSNTNFWYNSPGTYLTNYGFSLFTLDSNVITNGEGTAVEPFITVYKKMCKNGANTAMDLKTFGNSNSG